MLDRVFVVTKVDSENIEDGFEGVYSGIVRAFEFIKSRMEARSTFTYRVYFSSVDSSTAHMLQEVRSLEEVLQHLADCDREG